MTADAPLAALRRDLPAIAVLLRVLANPDRLAILCHLAGQEAAVSEIGAALDLRQPALSQQLGDLRENGLVQTRREARHIYYSLASPQVLDILLALDHALGGPDAGSPSAVPIDKPNTAIEAAQFARVVR